MILVSDAGECHTGDSTVQVTNKLVMSVTSPVGPGPGPTGWPVLVPQPGVPARSPARQNSPVTSALTSSSHAVCGSLLLNPRLCHHRSLQVSLTRRTGTGSAWAEADSAQDWPFACCRRCSSKTPPDTNYRVYQYVLACMCMYVYVFNPFKFQKTIENDKLSAKKKCSHLK